MLFIEVDLYVCLFLMYVMYDLFGDYEIWWKYFVFFVIDVIFLVLWCKINMFIVNDKFGFFFWLL